jgi:hypothetical protein
MVTGYLGHPSISKLVGIGVGSGLSRGIQGARAIPAGPVHQREQITTDPTGLWRHDALGGCGGDCRVHRIASGPQNALGGRCG